MHDSRRISTMKGSQSSNYIAERLDDSFFLKFG